MNNPELRAVLTEAIKAHKPTTKRINHPRRQEFLLNLDACMGCEWTEQDGGDHDSHVADVIASLPGVAVIQLPEPDEHEDEEQEFTDFPGVGLYVPVVFDRYPGEVQIRAGAWCDEPLSVDEARGLAASILAAASYAEEEEA
ncbi:hypothetical protein SEA_PHALCONET_76 [Mycobacterium phage Phalconet]|nr:hypothetical protein SEA_PHALCONET_76 [Mycobacterium phage Phalconet]